jgi:folate-binding protein YgfZ
MIIHLMTQAPYSLLDGVARLTHLGVIRAQGEDAVKFLQGQLTQDFALLKPSEARLAAFCSAKGRMQASFIGLSSGTNDSAVSDILLVCSRDILAPTLKRLSMFVMRAKAKLTDATDEIALYGLAGTAALAFFDESTPVWTKADVGTARVVKLYPADGTPRALWLAPVGEPAPEGQPMSQDMWQWSEVRSGIATITAPIVEAFVPQMLNYESVGGVNFKKGCYPGQEVVARSQFRGTLKRRGYIGHSDGALVVGQEIYAADSEQPAGIVAQVATAPSGGFDFIASLQTSAVQGGTLHLGAPDGTPIQLQVLPYELLEDI